MANQLYLTVDDVKKHLNIEPEFTEDDKYLLSLIEVAQLQVGLHLNGNSMLDSEKEILPNIKHAMLLLIGTLYSNRESVSYSAGRPVAHSYEYLLQFIKSYDYDFSE